LALARQELCPAPLKAVEAEQALCPTRSPLRVDGERLVLEEFEFQAVGEAKDLGEWLASRVVGDDFARARLATNLAVLHDDDFGHFARHATEVSARIALNYDTKTVAGGALFYQEFLPPETLFYSLLLAHPSRSGNGNGKDASNHKVPKTADEVLAYVHGHIHGQVLQVGGDETTGKGLCAVRIFNK
jgi:CRISPR-associated protein Cmr4